MTTYYIINYLKRRGYNVTYCNSSVFVRNCHGYGFEKKFPSYNAAYQYYKHTY